jgi:putative transposase
MQQSKIGTMQRLQAFKYELRPNGEQQRNMGRFAGSRRFVYNKGLALQKAHYEAGGTFIGYVAMAKLLTEWRHSAQTPWLKDEPVHPLQHALKDLERAYRNFFAQRGSFPRFKRKGRSESFRYPDAKQFESTRSIAESSYRSSAGYDIATAGKCWVSRGTSR